MSAREFLVHRCGGNPAMVDKLIAETLASAADEARQLKDRSWSYGAISEGHGARRVEDRLRLLARRAEAGER